MSTASNTENHWKQQILAYLDGDLDEASIHALSDQLESDREVRELFRELSHMEWSLQSMDKPALTLTDSADPADTSAPSKQSLGFMFLKVAALIAIAFIPTYLLSNLSHPQPSVMSGGLTGNVNRKGTNNGNPGDQLAVNIPPSNNKQPEPESIITRVGMPGGGRNASSGIKREPGDTGVVPKVIRFNQHVRPILSDKCFFCHGPDEAERGGDLRLDIRADALKAEAIVPGDLEASELIYRIELPPEDDDAMPPKKSHKELSKTEIAILKAWVKSGAKYEDHWAYTPVTRGKGKSIDDYVGARLKAEGLKFSKQASSLDLTRRLYLDLTGLPPEPEKLPLKNKLMSKNQIEDLVDELLASPHYGERMAVWWLDAVRYADTIGYHSDIARNAYPYRDYVINTFNNNKPFDVFTIEQIAGDLMPDAGNEQRIAASYNRLNQMSEEGGVQNEEYIKKYQSERVRTTSTAWLGSTLACAECHNHKFDPLSQEDFYSFAAFFADIYEMGAWNGEGEVNGDKAKYLDSPFTKIVYNNQRSRTGHIRDFQFVIAEGAEREKLIALYDAMKKEKEAEKAEKAEKAKKAESAEQVANKKNDKKKSDEKDQGKSKKKPQKSAAQKARDAFYSYQNSLPSTKLVMAGQPREVRILQAGNWMDKTGKVVYPATPAFLPEYTASTPDRRLSRLDLAKWIASKKNPLTARVFVNRLWAMFFGNGLSKVVNDFGMQGEWPEHPELLDWLSAEFMDSGWDVKHVVKLIVTSRTYLQSSSGTRQLLEMDPDNRVLARQMPRRLEGEFIRDVALASSGLLAYDMFGKPVFPYQPKGYWQHLQFPRRKYKPSQGKSQYRRGLYTHWQRTFLHPMMVNFDVPNRDECSMDRPQSNTPMQALTLMNDPSFVEAARALADSLVNLKSDNEKIKKAYLKVLSREPSTEEVTIMTALLNRERKRVQAQPEMTEAFQKVGDYKLKTEDINEATALAAVTRSLLNLHETITRY